LVLLSQDKEQLKFWRDEIDRFLQNKLKLRLHPQKQILQTVNKGINFVGFIFKPSYTLMRRRIVKNLKEKLWKLNQNLTEFAEREIKQALSTVNSYYGQFRHAKTFGLRQKLWRENFGELRKFLEPVDKNFSYFKIK